MSSYIEVRNVSKSFSGRAILQNISLSVEQGTTVGLVGANGSGKSVLFKIICGFEKPDQGSVYVRGRQIGKNGRDFPADMGVFINSPGFGNVKKCAVGKHPKSEKLGSTGQAACCACIHSRYFTGGSPSGLRV